PGTPARARPPPGPAHRRQRCLWCPGAAEPLPSSLSSHNRGRNRTLDGDLPASTKNLDGNSSALAKRAEPVLNLLVPLEGHGRDPVRGPLEAPSVVRIVTTAPRTRRNTSPTRSVAPAGTTVAASTPISRSAIAAFMPVRRETPREPRPCHRSTRRSAALARPAPADRSSARRA